MKGPIMALAQLIDHTVLAPEATAAEVAAVIAEAAELGTYAVCISPSHLPVVVPKDSDLKICAVVGFPSGAHTAAVKAAEAREAIALAADEIDMVINISAAKDGRFDLVEEEIRAVRAEIPAPRVLKVIIESAAMTDAEIVGCCTAAVNAGADFVKTSTGFHPAGGASVEAVALMAATVDGRAQVKASGAIRDYASATAMVRAGATRLGLSGSRRILAQEAGVDSEPVAVSSY